MVFFEGATFFNTRFGVSVTCVRVAFAIASRSLGLIFEHMLFIILFILEIFFPNILKKSEYYDSTNKITIHLS